MFTYTAWISLQALFNPLKTLKVREKVILRQAVYRQLVSLGAKSLEVHDHSSFFQLSPCGHSPYVTFSMTLE
jgi:hypothetical protein